jgi:hypothetical protein
MGVMIESRTTGLLTDRDRVRRPGCFAALVSVVLLGLAACGGGDDDAGDRSPVDPVADTAAEGAEGSTDAVDSADSDDALARLIASADAYDEVMTSSGGRVVVAVICESLTGGNIVSVGSLGVPEGIYEGSFEPASGGKLTLQVLPGGEGVGARQTKLDQPSYTISFADIDGGIAFTVPGCAG